MAFRFFQRTTIITTLLSTATAQTSNIVPSDLSAGFNDNEVQVSFSAKAVDGFASGTTFEKDAVAKEPTFALGDSNGISPSTLYTLIMVDTTCTNARKLHYARSNFKFSFSGGTNIETDSQPLLDYTVPGALGEQGDDRQYVFLMYTNPQRKEFAEMQLPAKGEVFDTKKFQGDNGLKDPVAGVGMVVKLGGTADCAGEGANPVPSGLPTAAPATSSGVASTTVRSGAASTATTAQPSTQPESALVSSSSIIVTSSMLAGPSSTLDGASSTLAGGDEGQVTTTTSAAQISSPADEDADPTSAAAITTLSSVRASATGSPITSGGPAEQTANAAPQILARRGAFVAPLLAIAGVLTW